MNEVTRILAAVGRGNPRAADELLPVVYDELRKLAAQRMAAERVGQTLQATALVHEAYLRLVDVGADAEEVQQWDGRGHFFAAAAEAMRRILVDNARRKHRPKHGGDRQRVELDEQCVVAPEPTTDLVALDEALARLAAEDPAKARLVTLRYFGGLTLEQAAAAMNVSPATAKRHWAYARAWLYRALADEES